MSTQIEKLKCKIIRLDAACNAEPGYVKRMPIIDELTAALIRYRKLAGLHEYASVGFLDKK